MDKGFLGYWQQNQGTYHAASTIAAAGAGGARRSPRSPGGCSPARA